MSYMPTLRQSVQWAQEELAKRGLMLSSARIRRYSRIGLVGEHRKVVGERSDRAFTEDDINRLEIITILKGVGLSHDSVKRWMQAPDVEQLVYRLHILEAFVKRGKALVQALSREAR